MHITIDANLISRLNDTLEAATKALDRSYIQVEKLSTEVYRNSLLAEKEAQAYLKRDADTLRYYRRLGLESFKKGKDRWYRKGDIDDWLSSGKVTRHKQKS